MAKKAQGDLAAFRKQVKEFVGKFEGGMSEALAIVMESPACAENVLRDALAKIMERLSKVTPSARLGTPERPKIYHPSSGNYEVGFWGSARKEEQWHFTRRPPKNDDELRKYLSIKKAGLSKVSWFWNLGNGKRRAGRTLKSFMEEQTRKSKQFAENELKSVITRKSAMLIYTNKLPWINDIVPQATIEAEEKMAARTFLHIKLNAMVAKSVKEKMAEAARQELELALSVL